MSKQSKPNIDTCKYHGDRHYTKTCPTCGATLCSECIFTWERVYIETLYTTPRETWFGPHDKERPTRTHVREKSWGCPHCFISDYYTCSYPDSIRGTRVFLFRKDVGDLYKRAIRIIPHACKRQLVVEGYEDYRILKAANEILSEKGMVSLRKDVPTFPFSDITNFFVCAWSFLKGREIKVALLLNGDEPGKRKEIERWTNQLTKYSDSSLSCCFVSTFAKRKEAELVDLFPENVYLDAVKEAYPGIQMPINFIQEEKEIQCIAERVKAAFKRLYKKYFVKGSPVHVILKRIQENPDILTEETLAKFESIFKEVNKRLR